MYIFISGDEKFMCVTSLLAWYREIMPEFLQMKVCTQLWIQWDELVDETIYEEVVSILICSFLDGSWSHMKCLLNSPLYRCRQKFHENLNHCDFETVHWMDYHNHGTIRNCQKNSFASFSFYFCVKIPGEYLSYFWNSCMELKQMESSTPLVSNYLGKVCSSK